MIYWSILANIRTYIMKRRVIRRSFISSLVHMTKLSLWCVGWNGELGHDWTSFYQVLKDKLGPIKRSLKGPVQFQCCHYSSPWSQLRPLLVLSYFLWLILHSMFASLLSPVIFSAKCLNYQLYRSPTQTRSGWKFSFIQMLD